jgi:hypothetical protein
MGQERLPALVPPSSDEDERQREGAHYRKWRFEKARPDPTKALCWALPGAYFDSLGLPYLEPA